VSEHRRKKVKLGELLLEQKLLTQEQLQAALDEQKRSGRKLGRVLTDLGLVREEKLHELLAANLQIPFIDVRQLTLDQQQEAARRGAFLEACLIDWYSPDVPRTHYYVERQYMHRASEVYNRKLTGPQWMNPIRTIGPQHFVLATDYGVRAAPSPVQGMRTMIASLLDYEFSAQDIRTMTALNPARLIGLEPL